MLETPESPKIDNHAVTAGGVQADDVAAPKKRWPLFAVGGVILAAVIASILLMRSGAASPTPAEAKSCLADAGYDTSGSTGVISLFAAGKELSMPDEFWAERGADQFAVWFFESADDAKAAGGALDNFAEQGSNVGVSRVAGSVAYAPGPSVSEASVAEVEDCLGF